MSSASSGSPREAECGLADRMDNGIVGNSGTTWGKSPWEGHLPAARLSPAF
ncbi:MAG: hypothetical protein ACREDR_10125 [Blastocatellia bacterium]